MVILFFIVIIFCNTIAWSINHNYKPLYLHTALKRDLDTTLSKQNTVTHKLKKYKELLNLGTYAGHTWDHLPVKPKSRYYTFKRAFTLFEQNKGKIIVELGTTRSFVDGRLPGCDSSDTRYWAPQNPERWDWSAGCFTRVAAECFSHRKSLSIYTVDLAKEHIKRCRIITHNFRHLMHYYVCSSEQFLNTCHFPKGIDLLYLDTGDMTPIEFTAQLQLREAKIIVERNLIAKNGLILIDDVKNPTPRQFGETSDLGKSKYALQYLLENGFKMIADEYQVLLQKIR